MQSIVIPGNHRSPVRIVVGQNFTEHTLNGTDLDAIGINLIGGQSYRITLDPAIDTFNNFSPSAPPKLDPLIGDILTSSGTSLGIREDDSGSGTASTLIFTPSISDTYFIVVAPQGPSDPGGWWTLAVNDFVAPADDFSNALDPSNPISIWETQDGHIGTAGDTDTIAISLQAGVAVDITLYGNDVGFYGELADTEIVSFVDANGVAVNPALLDTATAISQFTSGIGVDAHQLSFTPTQNGIFYLTVGAGPGEAVGDYSVSVSAQDRGIFSVRENEEFALTGNPEIDAFFNFGSGLDIEHIFSDRNGDGVTTLTFSVPGANPGFSPAIHNAISSEWTNGYAPASGPVLDTYFDVTDQISSFANIDFVQVADTGVEAGTFRIGDTDVVVGSASGALITGWSGFPEWMMAGETWINRDRGAQNTAIIQNLGASAVTEENFLINRTLHEFTHNLGLIHPDKSSLAGSIDPMLHGQAYSVMSRTSSGEFPNALVGDLFPQTLMWLDIQAIQAAYGVDTVTTGGADVYTFDTDARNFATIWDAGGNDTLVLNGSSDVTISLARGVWQDVGTSINYYDANGVVGVKTATVFIAPDTDIENVEGGGGNDDITGSASANVLDGGIGDDTLVGAAGADTLDGGSGTDLADYRSAASGVTVDLNAASQTGSEAQGDVLISIEDVFGSDFADQITGDAADNVLGGGAGADIIDGGAGMDTASYRDAAGGVIVKLWNGVGTGSDAAGDTLTSIENIVGSAFDDGLIGANGVDNVLSGGGGDDFLASLSGNDTLNGGAGQDRLDGGAGIDTADYSNASGRVVVKLWNGVGAGSDAAGDALTSIENIIGSAFDDGLIGANGADNVLSGGGGDDFLASLSGNDTLNGGAGADTLDGGSGVDTADYGDASGGVTVRLWNGVGSGGDAAGDALTSIENIIGSAFNDVLIGADGVANVLDGGDGDDFLGSLSGNDTLNGGDGNDRLRGGAGADVIDGGAGIDVANYGDASGGVVVKLWNGSGSGSDAAGDALTNIENIIGSAFNDGLIGANGADDFLASLSGNDTLNGGAGQDRLDGGAGIDTADYSNASGRVVVKLWNGVGAGSDATGDTLTNIENIIGSASNDGLIGANGVDNVLSGGGGDDFLASLSGNDTLNGGAGRDRLDGGSGVDTADYSDASGGVVVKLWNGVGSGSDAAGDTLTNIENLTGSAFDDGLIGANGADNVLSGGGGNDFLAGLSGNDTFVFTAGDDMDRIGDFTAGASTDDVIALSGFGASFDTFAEVFAAATESGGNTIIDFGNGDMLTLLGVAKTDLHQDDFLFI